MMRQSKRFYITEHEKEYFRVFIFVHCLLKTLLAYHIDIAQQFYTVITWYRMRLKFRPDRIKCADYVPKRIFATQKNKY